MGSRLRRVGAWRMTGSAIEPLCSSFAFCRHSFPCDLNGPHLDTCGIRFSKYLLCYCCGTIHLVGITVVLGYPILFGAGHPHLWEYLSGICFCTVAQVSVPSKCLLAR